MSPSQYCNHKLVTGNRPPNLACKQWQIRQRNCNVPSLWLSPVPVRSNHRRQRNQIKSMANSLSLKCHKSELPASVKRRQVLILSTDTGGRDSATPGFYRFLPFGSTLF